MKKISIFVLISALFIAALFTVSSLAATVTTVASGNCGSYVKWKLDSEGTLTLYGSGSMKNYSDSPWKSYNERINSIVIEEGVTSIGMYAFYELDNFKSLSLPTTLNSIGDYAFAYCKNLMTVDIPAGVTVIGESAFTVCYDLTDVTFHEGLLTIKDDAFSYCRLLTHITLPESLETLGYYAFGQCGDLVSINIPSKIKVLEKSTFSACTSLETVVLNEGLNTISASAFAYCYKLKNVTIPGSVQYIGDTAFYACSEMGTVKFNGAPPEMSDTAFLSSVATAKYPSPISSLWSSAKKSYGGSLSWSSYSVSGHNYTDTVVPPTCILRGYTAHRCTDAGCGEVYMDNYADALGHSWNSGVTSGNKTTYTCTRCAIQRYEYNVKGTCGTNARWTLDTEEGILHITGTGAINISSAYSMPWRSYISSIRHVIIDEGITSIGYESFFECENIESIEIPSTVKSIGESAFVWCSSLKELVIPEGVTEIKNSTFWGCESLKKLTLPSTLKKIGEEVFYSCDSLSSLVIPEGVTEIGELAFWDCKGIKKITIPSTVTKLNKDVFSGCSKLTSVTLPQTLTEIGEDAFDSCSALEKIIIPTGVKSIGDYAFYGCNSLFTVTIPGSVEYFGKGVFSSCNNLIYIYFTGNPPVFHENAFINTVADVKYPSINTDAWAEVKSKNYGSKVYWFSHDVTNGHQMTTVAVVPPTCLYRGYTLHTCTKSTCTDHHYMDAYTAPLGHAWDEGTGNSTKWTYTCTRCSEKKVVYNVTGICGSSGSNLRWSLNTEEGVLTISGSGYMKSYSKNSAPWNQYKDSIRRVVIEEGVQSVGSYAFYEHGALETVEMPQKLYSLGLGSFAWCDKLKAIRIPEGVTNIPEDCFWACLEMGEIILPSTLRTITQDAFYANRKVTTIDLPDSLTSIGDYAFWECTGLTSITIPDGVTVIRRSCFSSCSSLTSVTLSDNITEIGRSAFSGCRALTSINMPKNLKTIGINAFSYVPITSITFYSKVEKIDVGAFYDASIKEIHFKGDLPDLDAEAFDEVTAKVYYPAGNATWTGEARKNYGGYLTWLSEAPCSHNYEKKVTAPTCSYDGYTIFSCPDCAHTYKGDIVPATGEHLLTDWLVGVEATCYYEGIMERYCTTCTEVYEYEIIPMIDHDYVELYTYYPDCITGGWTEYSCTMCGEFYTDNYTPPSDDHPFDDSWEEIYPPTCTEDGLKARWCWMCGYEEQVYIPKLGHDYIEEETEAGGILYTCLNCGDSYEVSTSLKGDLNFDGEINVDDVLICLDLAFVTPTEEELKTADLDGNGKIDVDDVLICLDLCFIT